MFLYTKEEGEHTDLVCDIIHYYDTMSTSVVAGRDCTKPLLTRRVPLSKQTYSISLVEVFTAAQSTTLFLLRLKAPQDIKALNKAMITTYTGFIVPQMYSLFTCIKKELLIIL